AFELFALLGELVEAVAQHAVVGGVELQQALVELGGDGPGGGGGRGGGSAATPLTARPKVG
ncbi:MAG: hypothetical protein IJ087_09665, partial [Eggerthellaceae bacterium]|nr:hypothetical protein [Eggerthellaceae bacterium]